MVVIKKMFELRGIFNSLGVMKCFSIGTWEFCGKINQNVNLFSLVPCPSTSEA